MIEEAPVFGRKHRLDQMVRQFVERDGIVLLDAAAADFVAVTVEKHHGDFGLAQPVLVRGLLERRQRQRERDDEAAEPERRRFRQRLDHQPAPPAGDVKPVHEIGEALVEFAARAGAAENAEIDARVEVEQHPPEPGSPR